MEDYENENGNRNDDEQIEEFEKEGFENEEGPVFEDEDENIKTGGKRRTRRRKLKRNTKKRSRKARSKKNKKRSSKRRSKRRRH